MPLKRSWVTPFLFLAMLALDGSAQTKNGDQTGYVYCATDQTDHLTPVFGDPCSKLPVGNLSCGQKLGVVAQLGTWLKVSTPDGVIRFMNSSAVSQRPDQPVPIDIQAGPAPECKTPEREPKKNHAPRPVFTREPDYPGRHRDRKEGTVVLGLVVGTDGRPHDIKVVASLDKDFDKAAMEAVRQWRFEPGLKDGLPVEMPISVDIEFHVVH
jgi:TonB family protein